MYSDRLYLGQAIYLQGMQLDKLERPFWEYPPQ